MAKYRKRPIVVEANQFVHSATAPIPVRSREDGSSYVVTIHGQETNVVQGDWIIMEPDGIHAYPCKPDIFEKTYEAV